MIAWHFATLDMHKDKSKGWERACNEAVKRSALIQCAKRKELTRQKRKLCFCGQRLNAYEKKASGNKRPRKIPC